VALDGPSRLFNDLAEVAAHVLAQHQPVPTPA
jgi:hypothetical protein